MTEPRRVTVLGGGIVGVTSAYYLAQKGCRVVLVENNAETGLETSFANGGLITPSMSDPWASPGLPRLILKWLGRENAPFLVRPSALPGLFGWGIKFLRECNAQAWRRNAEIIYRLCTYSQRELHKLVDETGIVYDANPSGTLHLFRDEQSIESTKRVAEMLGQRGLSYRVLDGAGCIELEPALKAQESLISGGIHYPKDGAGDAHLFTQSLAQHCASIGVEMHYGEAVQRLEVQGNAVTTVVTDKQRIETDACVVALGNSSASMLRPLGIALPIYPVKCYSVTFPVASWNQAPIVPLIDDVRKIGIVRMGDRIRVAGTAEFTGHDTSINAQRISNLKRYFLQSFPDYPDATAARPWAGLRPMTPDGIPYLGQTPVEGLYLNTGHGHLGWTMSCGSAAAIANLITGQRAELDLTGMALSDR